VLVHKLNFHKCNLYPYSTGGSSGFGGASLLPPIGDDSPRGGGGGGGDLYDTRASGGGLFDTRGEAPSGRSQSRHELHMAISAGLYKLNPAHP
jgi:hypothetical protein